MEKPEEIVEDVHQHLPVLTALRVKSGKERKRSSIREGKEHECELRFLDRKQSRLESRNNEEQLHDVACDFSTLPSGKRGKFDLSCKT